MASFFTAPDANYFSTTLSGAISDSATTVTLSSVTNLNYPGVLVIDREDGSGNATPDAREVIAYTGISGSDLTGVTRGFSSSTARSHADGALVEAVVDVTLWNDLRDAIAAAMLTDGTGIHVSNASVAGLLDVKAIHLSSIASIAVGQFKTLLGSSIASIAQVRAENVGLNPVWKLSGTISLATVGVGSELTMPQSGTWESFSVVSHTIASNSSVIFDINKKGVSIFDAACQMSIAGEGTYASTASIKTKTFSKGDTFSVDVDSGDSDLWIEDVTVQGRGI